MKHMAFYTRLRAVWTYALAHKFISGIVLVAVIWGGSAAYGKFFGGTAETRYVLANVGRGTVISSVSASGQVSASNQLDIQAKASGEIISVNVVPGERVTAGTLIASIDPTNAQKAVRDAQANLESAEIAYKKLVQPADTLSLLQAQNALSDTQAALTKAYDDGFTNVSNAFLDLPDVMSGLQDVLYGKTVNKTGQDNLSAYEDMVSNYTSAVSAFADDAAAKYKTARTAYDKAFADYKAANRADGPDAATALVGEGYEATRAIADALKSANDLLSFVKDQLTVRSAPVPTILTTHQSSLATYTSQTNGHLTTLLNISTSIVSSKQTLAERTESLAKLQSGADPLDIETQKLSLTKSQNALIDAKSSLADYFVRAPFDGVIAKVNVRKYDTAGSAAIATLVTSQKMAQLSLNEVDAAKVSLGDKATLTFDAIEDLTLTGQVAEIDTIGTVAQNVVSYSVTIGFDTQDDRVKPGMTVNAAIQTDVKQDVLMVPSSAVKTQSGVSYVQVFSPALAETGGAQGVTSPVAPKQLDVVVGISDDTNVEIVSGLTEGDQIVTRTISATASAGAAATTNRGPAGAGIRL